MILIPYSFVQRLDLQYYAVVELEILEQQHEYHFILHETKHQILFYCEYLLVLVLLLLVVLMMLVLMLLLVVVLL